jgi:2-aminoadipate transaminase
VLVERPTYLGALQAWAAYQARYLTVDVDDDGSLPEEMEASLRAGPKFIYALPNFQNPTGVTLSLDRRRRLVTLADHYGVPILEDDPYGQLRYEGEHLPSLVALDAEYRASNGALYSGNVIYLSTFSKTLAPGLRLGWIIASDGVIDRIVQAKQGTDLHTSTFTQRVAYEMARGGFLDEHVRVVRRAYQERRDAMLAAMTEFFPPEVSWTTPTGGLFLWVRLPETLDAADVLQEALKQRVAFLVGSAFFVDGSGRNTARFNFSNAAPARIYEGIKRIGAVLHRMVHTRRMELRT